MPANTSLPQPDDQGGSGAIVAAALVERLQKSGWVIELREYSFSATMDEFELVVNYGTGRSLPMMAGVIYMEITKKLTPAQRHNATMSPSKNTLPAKSGRARTYHACAAKPV